MCEQNTLRSGPPLSYNPRQVIKIEVKLQNRVLEHYNLEKPLVTIGRDPSCDVAVDNPLLSRRHAQIVCENGRYYVEDLKSTNGVFLRGNRVSKEEIRDGDEFRIDKFSFHVRIPEVQPEKKKEFAFDIMGTMQIDSKALQEKLRAESAAGPAQGPQAIRATAVVPRPAAPPAKGPSAAVWIALVSGLVAGFAAGFLTAHLLR